MIKIAFIPTSRFSKNLGYDLRNLILYSKLKKIKIHRFRENQKYDYLVLPPTYDISNLNWLRSRKEKIIYQLVDDYFSERKLSFKNLFRGLYKFIKREHKNIIFDYKKNLEEICKISDAVICSSKEQKKKILKFNKNVKIFFEGNFKNIKKVKRNFKTEKVFKIIWEGRCENISSLSIFYPAFKKLIQKNNIELHIISDFEIKKIFSLTSYKSLLEIKKIFKSEFSTNTTFKKSRVYFHQWSLSFVNLMIHNSDMAIIPIKQNKNFEKGRSNNKLMMFMRNRIPVLTSKINSYEILFKNVNIDACCSSTKQWVNKIQNLINSENLRKKYAISSFKYIKNNFGKKQFIKQWEDLFKI